jgi:Pvc16 N-terminal domain
MIPEVDESLRGLLIEHGLGEGGVDIVFDAPTKEWAARRNAPTVSVFLYGIRQDSSRSQTGAAEELADDGTVTGWRTPPRWFELAYLVTAWTNRPQDEHRLLSQALRCLVTTQDLPSHLLTGSLAELGLAISLDTAVGSEHMPSASDVWSALGTELKPSVDLRVIAPLSGERLAASPTAGEGLVVRTTATAKGAASGGEAGASGTGPRDPARGRRLRYDRGADPGPDGFAAPRPRPQPPVRRRRGGTAP